MAGVGLLVGVLLAQASPVMVTVEGAQSADAHDWVDVGYAELASGDAERAIAKIRGNRRVEAGDPSALINLGSAHALLGRADKAEGYYKAAILSTTRYDLQLADGRWVDSRRAARMAIAAARNGKVLALR